MNFFHACTETIIDTLFPPSHDAILVREAPPGALAVRVEPRMVRGITVLLPFRDPLVRAAIHEAKFHGNKKAFQLLGYALEDYLKQLPALPYLLVPVPLSGARKRARGFNQVAEIAKYSHDAVIREDVLKRARHTKPQTELSKEERAANVRGAFVVTNSSAHSSVLSGAHILLFDDVVTSGATLRAAKAALTAHRPASVTCVALAH